MRIKVKSFATLRNYMEKEADLDVAQGTTVSGLLDLLSARHAGLHEELFEADGTLKQYVNILKNGRNVYFIQDLDTVLEENDDIALFPPIAGG